MRRTVADRSSSDIGSARPSRAVRIARRSLRTLSVCSAVPAVQVPAGESAQTVRAPAAGELDRHPASERVAGDVRSVEAVRVEGPLGVIDQLAHRYGTLRGRFAAGGRER